MNRSNRWLGRAHKRAQLVEQSAPKANTKSKAMERQTKRKSKLKWIEKNCILMMCAWYGRDARDSRRSAGLLTLTHNNYQLGIDEFIFDVISVFTINITIIIKYNCSRFSIPLRDLNGMQVHFVNELLCWSEPMRRSPSIASNIISVDWVWCSQCNYTAQRIECSV